MSIFALWQSYKIGFGFSLINGQGCDFIVSFCGALGWAKGYFSFFFLNFTIWLGSLTICDSSTCMINEKCFFFKLDMKIGLVVESNCDYMPHIFCANS